ncbi:MAG: hypothetical protein JW874_08415 [Spirochaetales bacterium]|nr:hypothetical protein [Spirochaetales bacterium]
MKRKTDRELYKGVALSLWIIVIAVIVGYSCDMELGIPGANGELVADHTVATMLPNGDLPVSAIENAKETLHIAYGHTSHGSQLVSGMEGLIGFANNQAACNGAYDSHQNLFDFNNGGTGGALDLADSPFDGAADLGNPDRESWAAATRTYLNDPANADTNVIIWSWCGQADGSEEDIDLYLNLMSALETEYPDVTFVYMTGHLVGVQEDYNLRERNNQIRDFCETNHKWLYDFEDIERFDPDGADYSDMWPTDGNIYDADGNDEIYALDETTPDPAHGDRNWALDWQILHTEGVDWYDCGSAHSTPLNANRKAYAAWWLWCRLAGWGS